MVRGPHCCADLSLRPSPEIVVISRSDWSRIPGGYSDKTVVGAITALALSPNGAYLLSACKSTVLVWSTQTKRSVSQHTAKQGTTITQLAFNPRRNLLAWADKEGGFTRWIKPVPTEFPDPIRPSIGTKAGASTTITREPDTDLFGEDDLGKEFAMDGDVDLAALDDDEDMLDPDKDWIIDDIGGGLNDEPARDVLKSNGYVKEMVSITKAQPPFQPGSTPFQNKKRYLGKATFYLSSPRCFKCFAAYNILGVIEAIDQDIHQVINVVFFNQSSRSSFHFTDLFKNDMAYLGDCGAVFACPPEENHPARVLFKPYSPTAQEWTYSLRPSTRVLGVAAGGLAPSTLQGNNSVDLQGYGNVVIATSEHDLTFLSGTGRERRIIALPGDFVTMIASPEWVLVVYRPGSTTIDGKFAFIRTCIGF
jgi:chromosome transmission fidelity protein 4